MASHTIEHCGHGHKWDLRLTVAHRDGLQGTSWASTGRECSTRPTPDFFPSLSRATSLLLTGLRENVTTNNGEPNYDRDLRERDTEIPFSSEPVTLPSAQ